MGLTRTWKVLDTSSLQSFPASGSFPTSQFFTYGGQSIGVSASASVLPMNIQDWFPLGWTGWISLQSKGLSRVFPTPQVKSINCLALSFLYSSTLTSIYDYWKNHSFDYMDLSWQSQKWSEVTQSCSTLCDPMDWSLPSSSVHGILQAIILEWVAISFSRGSSWPRYQTRVSHIGGRRFNLWATREATR